MMLVGLLHRVVLVQVLVGIVIQVLQEVVRHGRKLNPSKVVFILDSD